jgi:hypothetical protein
MLHVLIKHRHMYFYATYGTTSSCMLTPRIWSVVTTYRNNTTDTLLPAVDFLM